MRALLFALALVAALVPSPLAQAGETSFTGYRDFERGVEYKDKVWESEGHGMFQREDGAWVRVDPDGTTRESDPPEEGWLQKWRPRFNHEIGEGSQDFSGSLGGVGGERNRLDWIGAEGTGSYSAALGEDGLRVKGALDGRLYLAQLEFDVEGTLGGEDARVQARLRGEAFAGADGELKGGLDVDNDSVAASAGVAGFAGAKGTGRLPISVTLCALSATADLAGEVSYGVGGAAKALFEIDWSGWTAEISSELSATLGLGAGAGGKVKVDLGALLKDTDGTMDCLRDQLAALGRSALDLGGTLLEATASLGSALGEAGQALLGGLERAKPDASEGAGEAAVAIVEAVEGCAAVCR